MSLIGKGRVFSETRWDAHCGTCTLWHVVMFVDDFHGKEHEVGRFIDALQAEAVRARWAKETCVTTLAPIKFTASNKLARQSSSGPRGHRKAGSVFRRDIPKPAMKTETKTEIDLGKGTGTSI